MNKKQCVDHNGKRYNSINDMCKAYGITRNMYESRKAKGCPLEQILDPKKDSSKLFAGVKCTDHKGQEFDSVRDMCNYYHISTGMYYKGIKDGISLERVLTGTVKEQPKTQIEELYRPELNVKCKDHLNNKYDSITQMCAHYNILPDTYFARIQIGWSKEKALTTHSVV